jgi:hypothetical protein
MADQENTGNIVNEQNPVPQSPQSGISPISMPPPSVKETSQNPEVEAGEQQNPETTPVPEVNWEERYKSLTQEYESFKQADPFANEFVKKFNDLFSNGAEQEKINQFVNLHFNGVENKSAIDKIKMQIGYQNPRWSNDMIEDKMEEMFGVLPDKTRYEEDDNLDEYERLLKKRNTKIERYGLEAEDFLNKEKTSFEMNTSEAKQEEEQRRALLQNSWMPHIQRIQASEDLFQIELPNDNSTGIPHPFEFKWKPEIPQEYIQKVQEVALRQVVEAGLPFTQENLNHAQEQAQNWIKMAFYDDFMKAAITDAINSTRKLYTIQGGSSGQVPTGSAGRTTVPKPKVEKRKAPPQGFL